MHIMVPGSHTLPIGHCVAPVHGPTSGVTRASGGCIGASWSVVMIVEDPHAARTAQINHGARRMRETSLMLVMIALPSRASCDECISKEDIGHYCWSLSLPWCSTYVVPQVRHRSSDGRRTPQRHIQPVRRAGHADHQRVGGHVAAHHRAGADERVLADRRAAHDRRVGADAWRRAAPASAGTRPCARPRRAG